MVFVWAVQAQADNSAWQKDIILIFESSLRGHV